jgi:hypothetical protein
MVVPDNADLKREIVQSHHDSVTAGHPGREKTLDLVTSVTITSILATYLAQILG